MIYISLFIFFILSIGLLAIIVREPRFISFSPWQHFYENLEIPPKVFYKNVIEATQAAQIPDVDFDHESFIDSHMFSSRREYLKISKGEFVFFVCAAPYGTGTFVSHWLCVKGYGLIEKIPVINKMAGKDRKAKTFYQIDTEAMFKSSIHSVILSTLESMTESHGVRLTESERQFTKS